MSDESMTFGEIRKRVEIKMNRELGVYATEAQLHKLRELAPDVAEGRLTYEAAMERVRDAEDES